jgi:hypothetical protein
MGTWLAWTGQSWRVAAFSGCLVGGTILLLAGSDGSIGFGFVLLGLVLWLSGVVGLLAFVRCSKCKARVIWKHAYNRESDPRFRGLFTWTSCPLCGYSAAERELVAPQPSDPVLALTCLIERIDGQLLIVLPLDEGGRRFVKCARGISHIHDDALHIQIPEWLSGMLRVEEGDSVSIDNADGKFNIRGVNARPIH